MKPPPDDEQEDPFSRPVWEDEESEGLAPWRIPTARTAAEPSWRTLLLPLTRAQDALVRLEVAVAAASDAIQEGWRARMGYREAAGWLAHQGAWVHWTDLALRDARLTGSFVLARDAGRLAAEMPGTIGEARASGGGDITADGIPDDALVGQALVLARLWRRQASGSGASGSGALLTLREGIGRLTAIPPPAEAWPGWLGRARELGRAGEGDDLPALLRAAAVAKAWHAERGQAEEGRGDRLSVTGLFVGGAVWRALSDAPPIGLAFWSAPPSRLHALALAGDAAWHGLFLAAIAEAGRQGRQELDRLLAAEGRAGSLPATARSRLPDALVTALRVPVFTSRGLAEALGVSSRAGLSLALRLAEVGLLREATGRAAWRAFTLA